MTRCFLPTRASLGSFGVACWRLALHFLEWVLHSESLEALMLRPQKIVVADDDQPMRALLTAVLRHDGYDVGEAADGRQLFWAIARSSFNRPVDLVISDLSMPAYDGLEIAEAWAEVGCRPHILLMTAFPTPETERRAATIGIGMLAKPFTPDQLQRVVATFFDAPSPC